MSDRTSERANSGLGLRQSEMLCGVSTSRLGLELAHPEVLETC